MERWLKIGFNYNFLCLIQQNLLMLSFSGSREVGKSEKRRKYFISNELSCKSGKSGKVGKVGKVGKSRKKSGKVGNYLWKFGIIIVHQKLKLYH